MAILFIIVVGFFILLPVLGSIAIAQNQEAEFRRRQRRLRQARGP